MGLTRLTERHADQIAGVLSCYDRILVFGTLPTLCFAEGMTSYLYAHQIRIFDYPRFAEPLPESTTGERGATGNRERHRDRTPWQEECAQRGLGPGGAGQARAAPRAGRDLLGDGALPDLAAVAQQGDGQDLLAARRRQMLALLFLLYRGRTRADLRPCPHLVAVPFADLLQRT